MCPPIMIDGSGAGHAGKAPARRRKRQTKEPKREDFGTDEEYQECFTEWRRFRKFQQQSVARSRAKAKRAEYEQELEIRATEHDNALLTQRIADLEKKIQNFVQQITEYEDSVQIVPSIDF